MEELKRGIIDLIGSEGKTLDANEIIIGLRRKRKNLIDKEILKLFEKAEGENTGITNKPNARSLRL